MGNLFILLIAICFLKTFTESASSENKDTDNVELEAVPSPSPEMVRKPYDTKFDNIDIDDLLKNDRLLKNYVKCLEYEGPCTPDGKMLRDILPDALLTNCEKCSERQKYASEKVIHYFIDARKEYWDELERIYDPDGSYRNKYLLSKLEVINGTMVS